MCSHVSWGHHLNIHKHFADMAKRGWLLDGVFQEPVTVTEKVDGSNLGIHIRRTAAAVPPLLLESFEFELVALFGRNATLWSSSDAMTKNVVPNLKYGNAGALEALPAVMFKFACSIAEHLGTDELIIYGEAYRSDGAQKRASWHPFGYKIRRLTQDPNLDKDDAAMSSHDDCSDDEGDSDGIYWTKCPLTLATHQLFTHFQTSAVAEVVDPNADGDGPPSCVAYLDSLVRSSSEAHVIRPPNLLFASGTFALAVDALFPLMEHPPTKCFEGAFVTFERTRRGFKWKTGNHEEQKGILTADDLHTLASVGYDAIREKVAQHVDHGDAEDNRNITWMRASLVMGCGFKDRESFRLYKCLEDVFRSHPSFPEPAKAAKVKVPAAPKAAKPIEVDVEAAIQRELSKSAVDIESIPKKARAQVVEIMVPRVVREVQLVFEESGMKCPYADTMLLSVAQAKTISSVMKVPFTGPSGV
jgi:hypothetical protein